MGVRVASCGGAEPRGGSDEQLRYTFAHGLDRAAAWIALATPLFATVAVLIAR